MQDIKISPEALEIANAYLQTMSIKDTASLLGIAEHTVAEYIDKREVKSYVDAVFLEQGYMNKYKLQSLLTDIIDNKLEEVAESGIYSQKDIVDILKLAHDMRMKEIDAINKANSSSINKQINIQQNNYSDQNYVNLLNEIMNGKK